MQFEQLAAGVAVGAGSFAQAATGIGFALICSPLLVLCVGPKDGVLLSHVIGTLLSALIIVRDWHSINWRHVAALFIPAAAIAPLASLVAHRVSASTLSVVVGVLILIAVSLLASGIRSHWLRGVRGAVGTGFISGAMSVLAGVGGPPVALYALNSEWEPSTIRGTLNIYFIGMSFITFSLRGLPDVSAGFIAFLTVTMALGFIGGRIFVKRIDHEAIRNLILLVATIGGLAAIANGLAQ